MKSKRLLFSDLHLHTWTYGATVNADGFNSRLAGQAKALDNMLGYALEAEVEYAYFLGDLFHTHGRVPTQALQVAAMFFKDLRDNGIKIRAMYGNHDMDDKHGNIHALSWLDYDELLGEWLEDDGLLVQALPYTEDEDTLKRFLGDASEGAMLLLHQGVAGVPLSSGYVLDEKLTPDLIPDYCTAFTGHYHFHKRVSDNLTVVGNLTPLNWSDIDQTKGFVLLDDDLVPTQIPQEDAPNFRSWSEDIAKHSDLANVEDSFIRYTDEVKQSDQEGIRKALIKEGALTVEFPKVEIEVGASAIRTGEEITVEHLVKTFETEDMEPRRLEVGLEVREERYEAPKV
jgi:DNA repair exonuclease SbcCD nuclease subunit